MYKLTLICWICIMPVFAEQFKDIKEYSINCAKLDSLPVANLKSLSFEDFRQQIGYIKDVTIVRRKDFDEPKDLRNYDYQQTNQLYKKYCEAQHGTLYGNENEYYHPIGKRWPPKKSWSSEFGNETVCMVNNSALFVKNFTTFYEKCSMFCDYPKQNIEHAEFTLTNDPKTMDLYTLKFNEFRVKNEIELKKEAEHEHLQAEQEARWKQYALENQKKYQALIESENEVLKARKGQQTYIFYDNFIFTPSYSKWGNQLNNKNECVEHCNSLNRPFSTIQEAFDYGWEFVSLIDNNVHNVTSDCECIGKKYILKH